MVNLRELSKENLDLIISSNPGEFAIYKMAEGRLLTLYVSESLCRIAGMSKEAYMEFTREDAMSLVIESDRKRVYESLMNMIINGGDGDLIYHTINFGGPFVCVHAKTRVIGMADESQVILANFSVTSLEAKGQSELLNNIESIIYVVDMANYELLYANEPALKFWGRKDYWGHTCFSFVNGSKVPCKWCSIPKIVNGSFHSDASYSPAQDKWFEIDCKETWWQERKAVAVWAHDVTQKHRRQLTLEMDKKNLDNMLGNIPGGVAIFSCARDGGIRIDYANDGFYRVHFGSRQYWNKQSDNPADWILKSDRNAFSEEFKKVNSGEKNQGSATYRVRCEDNCLHWINNQFSKAYVNNDVQYFYSTFTCIDDQKEAEKAKNEALLKERDEYEKLYQRIAGTLSDAVSSTQLNLTKNSYIKGYSEMPEVIKKLEKKTADEHFMAAISSVTDEKIKTEMIKQFNCANLIMLYNKGEKNVTKEYPVITSKGNIKWISTVVYLLKNPYSGDIEALSYARDISRMKRDEEIVLRISKDGCDFIGIIDTVNANFEIYDGSWNCSSIMHDKRYRFEIVRQKLIDEYMLNEDKENFMALTDLGLIADNLNKEDQYTVFYGMRDTHSGKILKKQLRFTWLNNNKNEIMVVQNDISQAYYKEQEQIKSLNEAVIEAEKASSAKSEFVSRISHDIRTPLSIISSMTHFAFEDIGNAGRLASDLRKIEASSEFLLSLINDVLDISKVDSGKTELHLESYLFADYISNIKNMFDPLCSSKNIGFTVHEPFGLNAIMVDRTRLNQITLNLMSNAIKYTNSGGRIDFFADGQKRDDGLISCMIEVRDNGIGMSEAFQKIMFDPFTQEYENPGRQKAMTGTGLGLAIVKKIVDLLGGTISVKSKPGEGTDIKVEFNAYAAGSGCKMNQVTDEADENGASDEKLSGKVLLAEDNMVNAEIAKRILNAMGIEAMLAENGKEAYEKFIMSQPGTFKAILMDIQMPVMNGYDAVEKIRASGHPEAKTVPVIAMTADAFLAAVEHCKKVGMNDYLTKPIDPKLLKSLLKKLLAENNQNESSNC